MLLFHVESDKKPCVELKSGDRVRQSAPRQKLCQLSGLQGVSWSQVGTNENVELLPGDQSEEVFSPNGSSETWLANERLHG